MASKSIDDQIGLFSTKDVPNAFRKAVQVVHSKPMAPLSLVQRKLLNSWLKNAANTPHDSEGWWAIRIDAVCNEIGFNSNNRSYLKESSEALMRIIFTWDVLAPEEKRARWKASVLFPEVEITRYLIKYQISSQLQAHILKPEMYALIDQAVLRKYRRAASAGIYEHCIRFEKINQTPAIPWQEFRDIILGVSADKKSYKEYKSFKQKVLNPCIAEINAEGAIQIELRETKVGKTVEGVFFKVQKPKLAATSTEDVSADEAKLIGNMVLLGIMHSEAKRMLQQNPASTIEQALAYTNERRASTKAEKLENPAAYFRKALSQRWQASVDIEDAVDKVAPAVRPQKQDIPAMYKASKIDEADEYFQELDGGDQSELISMYNNQQSMKTLLLKSKPTKPSQAAFNQWLMRHLWGDPTPEQYIEFAQNLLNTRSQT
ncbi:replication initiation protein [Polaromonas naphthalenivorans]|nr:replication initiation protein [Polaromonas naphthalenivorans]